MDTLPIHLLLDVLFILAVTGTRWLWEKYKPISEKHAKTIEAAGKLLMAMDEEIMDSLPADSLRKVAFAAAGDLFEDGELGRDSFDAVYEEALKLFSLSKLASKMEDA